ncbi:hypothetical protein [Pedobacter sp. L105]|uniref:hypothetical protein n=1 Tax=Pedobacter sp. L105 TaxID=1641871 RepID=UPI00131DC470|nr:hypothetical protein [Pedobacter sp. L105]
MERRDGIFDILIRDIDGFSLRAVKKNTESKTIELWADPLLLSNISGWFGALFIRAILRELNINEHHVFRWRLENKYIQYLVLNNYAPGCMPRTISLSKLLYSPNGVSKTRELFKKGFFLKKTLGYGSFTTHDFDKTAEFEDILSSHQETYFYNEKWILQKKLTLDTEFRVHTFNKDIIYGLTFKIQGLNSIDNSDAEEFVKGVLEKLPDQILQGTLIGWDIGLTNNNKYYVIEANFTGFHPEFGYGFQTSGYVDDHLYGPIICAWLNSYFENKYRVSIASIENSLLSNFSFYKECQFYLSLFRNPDFDTIRNHISLPASVVLHLGDASNSRLITLITYFQLVNFVDKYYIIVQKEHFSKVNGLFKDNHQIQILTDDIFFTPAQYQLIQHLGVERRKQICRYHARSLLNKEPRILI